MDIIGFFTYPYDNKTSKSVNLIVGHEGDYIITKSTDIEAFDTFTELCDFVLDSIEECLDKLRIDLHPNKCFFVDEIQYIYLRRLIVKTFGSGILSYYSDFKTFAINRFNDRGITFKVYNGDLSHRISRKRLESSDVITISADPVIFHGFLPEVIDMFINNRTSKIAESNRGHFK